MYSISETLSSGFKNLGHEVSTFDFRENLKKWEINLNTQIFRLPYKARKKWHNIYMGNINKMHINNYNKVDPDIVFIYNNEMLLPETIEYFSKKSKVIISLGDNPFYTPTNDYFLDLLFHADLVLSPDSFWKQQLNQMGLKNCITEFFNTQHKPFEFKNENDIEPHDLLFIGMSYVTSWGYKRALFLSKFADMDIRIHGNSAWYRWLDFFPELKPKFILKGRYSDEYMAKLHLSAKIYPFEANPGLLNGIHVRLFDCIEYGILPIPEYRKDIEQIFAKEGLPIIYNYNKAKEVASYYLKNELERKELVSSLKNYIRSNYNPEISLERVLNKLKS